MNEKHRKILTTLLKLLATVGILWWIVNKTGGVSTIASTIASADPQWLLLALLTFTISIFLGALQWRAILRSRGIDISPWKIIRIYTTGVFLTNFIGGNVASDAYKIKALHNAGSGGHETVASTFLDRLTGLLIICLFAVAGGTIILMRNVGTTTSLVPAITSVALFTLILLGIALSIVSRTLQGFLRRMIAKLPQQWHEKITPLMDALFINRREPDEKRMVLTVIAYSIVIQSMRIGVHVLCGVALGLFTVERLPYFFVIVPMAAIMMILPQPPGTKDALAATLFSYAGFRFDGAVAMEFLAMLIGIGSSVVGGIFFITEKKK